MSRGNGASVAKKNDMREKRPKYESLNAASSQAVQIQTGNYILEAIYLVYQQIFKRSVDVGDLYKVKAC